MSIFQFIFYYTLGLFLATLMLTLQQNQLFKLYWNLTTGILLLYLPFQYVVMKVLEPTLNGIKINDSATLTAFLLCTATGLLAVHLSEEKTWKAAVLMVNTLTVAAVYIGLPPYVTRYIHGFTATSILCNLFYRVSLSMFGLMEEIYLLIYLIRILGFNSVAKPILDSIQRPFLVFWLATFAYSSVYPVKEIAHVDWTTSLDYWLSFLSTCVEECCRTKVGLMATSVVVAYAASYARILLEAFLYGSRRTGNHYTSGWIEGVAFFFISIHIGVLENHQTDTHKDVQSRLYPLKITSLLVVAIFLETTYQTLDSKIMSFSASTKYSNHIRPLMTYIILLLSSCYVVYTVCNLVGNGIPFPLVIVTDSTIIQSASSLIQIVASLFVYTIFLYDIKYSVENLDDMIFYIRSFVSILVLVGSVNVSWSGLWVVIIEGLSWIQTSCLIIYFYFKVWKRLKDGYYVFTLMKNCREKMNSLTWATNEELNNHDDVCSICYQGMSSAKITPCGHFFHQGCLQKWINDNNTCPLCSYRISV